MDTLVLVFKYGSRTLFLTLVSQHWGQNLDIALRFLQDKNVLEEQIQCPASKHLFMGNVKLSQQ